MNNYFEVKVKFLQIDQNGNERKKTEVFLFDAMSYTETESKTIKLMEEKTNGEFQIMNIKNSNITEVIKTDGEWMFKAKIQFVSIDETSGKEKKFSQYILTSGVDIDQASLHLSEGLSHMLIPYEIAAIVKSPISEVIEHETEKN